MSIECEKKVVQRSHFPEIYVQKHNDKKEILQMYVGLFRNDRHFHCGRLIIFMQENNGTECCE